MRHTAVLPVLLVAVLHSAAASAGAVAEPAANPSNAQVYFIWPHDGTVIEGGRFWLRMGLRNMGVAPKGTDIPDTGHHHVLIDTALPSMTEPIPNDRNHLHFGAGETEARIELPPGTHTLQLLVGDMNHVPHTPPVVSKKITVTVR
ncbi:MAG: ATPase [Massilia sp.]|nr:ATPase [Massilia sp.]